MRNLILLLSLCGLNHIAAQAVMVLNGSYTGKNLYIQNPYENDGKGFCTKKVLVNGKEMSCNVNSTAFEIKLDSCGLKEWDSVEVKIIHSENCMPKVLNPYLNCTPRIKYVINEIYVKGDSVLCWKAKEQGGKWRYTIEQFRWNKWVKLGDTLAKSGEGNAEYSFSVSKYLHGGKNEFRLKFYDYGDWPHTSKSVHVLRPEENDHLKNTYRRDEKIELKRETLFELFDHYGNVIKRGIGDTIELSGLKKGTYYFNYENFVTEFLIVK